MTTPAISVVICAYNSRPRIGSALRSLYRQELSEPFEIVVVASGDDGWAEHLRIKHPSVRVVASPDRLHPGAARNAGVSAARGEFVAFLADDCAASPDWLSLRLERHRGGARLVGGAVSNGTPRNLVGTAGYYVEYCASMPVASLLRRQPIPHTLSYEHALLEELGGFPELDVPGEDTLFNARCVDAGIAVEFEERACIAHRNITQLMPFLRHQAGHGRGLARCVATSEIEGPFDPRSALPRLAVSTLVSYPVARMVATVRLLARHAPSHLPRFIALTPLITAGYLASGLGAWRESREVSPADYEGRSLTP